jgi:hypothetical protein
MRFGTSDSIVDVVAGIQKRTIARSDPIDLIDVNFINGITTSKSA